MRCSQQVSCSRFARSSSIKVFIVLANLEHLTKFGLCVQNILVYICRLSFHWREINEFKIFSQLIFELCVCYEIWNVFGLPWLLWSLSIFLRDSRLLDLVQIISTQPPNSPQIVVNIFQKFISLVGIRSVFKLFVNLNSGLKTILPNFGSKSVISVKNWTKNIYAKTTQTLHDRLMPKLK